MECSDLLVEFFGEDVYLTLLILVVVSVFPEFDLSEHLVRERTRHNETRVAGGTSKVHETALSEKDDTVTIGEFVAVDLGFDVHNLDAGVVIETINVNFIVKVPHVSNNRVVLHLSQVFSFDNLFVTSASDIDISCVKN